MATETPAICGSEQQSDADRVVKADAHCDNDVDSEEQQQPPRPRMQARPSEFPNLAAEITCILVCSVGQLFYSVLLGNIEVNQAVLIDVLGIPDSKTPWLLGSYLLANGVSVSVCGSLIDLVPPRGLMISAFVWMTVWNIIGAFTISTSVRWSMFVVVRAMQGVALGALVSGSISILGRIYQPGLRKTRAFSLMACLPPIGFSVGGLQGGALSKHLSWVFGSTAALSGICTVAAAFTIPSLRPAKIVVGDETEREASIRDLDLVGAGLLVVANTLMLFGITQGSSAQWAPYTYSLAIVGFIFLGAFYFFERWARRPLIPPQLWSTKGFTPLMISFALAYGSWLGAWQPYALQFFLFIQHASPIQTAIWFIPNALVGLLAVYVVQYTMHKFAGQWIFAFSMLANALAPALFLPITPTTTYWALAMPGIALGTFGPDMSFVAASIFITSSVPRSYQGAAGSLLLTIENLSSAVFVAVAGAIGAAVNEKEVRNSDADKGGEEQAAISLQGLRAIWWFGLSTSVLAAVLTAAFVRIKKAEERTHVSERSAPAPTVEK